ncbi:hypothetical protein KC945_02755 [Candidatus Saccharibacteria bacterium]|jgi:hypothetical protein|nr:hypothetical protein [Candidatus Saccharibacteria bacterium]
MRTVVVYRDKSDHAREVIDYLRDFSHQTGGTIETIDPDTRDGIGFCSTYDIVEYPTMVALADDGQLLNQWRGRPLPTISEVSFYAN